MRHHWPSACTSLPASQLHPGLRYAEVVTADGTEVGEIDEVLVDPACNAVAVVVELDGSLVIGDEDIVFA